MTVYFISNFPATLQLNGIYLGMIDKFERRIDVDLSEGVMAQIIPDKNAEQLNFFINDNFLSCPPPCVDTYVSKNEAILYFKYFENKRATFDVIAQTKYCDFTVTVFNQNRTYAALDGQTYHLISLPDGFVFKEFETHEISGSNLLFIKGLGILCVISPLGDMIFCEEVNDFSCGITLKTVKKFATCRQIEITKEYSFDGESLNIVNKTVKENAPLMPHTIPFAFFESVLHGGDFSKYLCEEMKAKANVLPKYLGNFVDVCVPTEKFYMQHDNESAVGLIYKKKPNLYDLKYFAVTTKADKITNVYPVE